MNTIQLTPEIEDLIALMIGVQELKRGESFDGREFINRLKANNLQNCGY